MNKINTPITCRLRLERKGRSEAADAKLSVALGAETRRVAACPLYVLLK